jgi:RNA polymerase sigma factor (sigma-70 family)
MKRLKKTSKNNRSTYIYYDLSGKKMVELHPGEDGVTEADISMLHEMDDADFLSERRENHIKPYRYEAYGSDDDDDAVDKNPWLLDECANPETLFIEALENSEYEIRLMKLTEAMAMLLPAQKELFIKVYVERRRYTDIAAEEGVTEAAIRNRIKKLHARLKKYF